MSRPEHNYLPVIPDALQTEEFLPIVIEDGRARSADASASTSAPAMSERSPTPSSSQRGATAPGQAPPYPLVLRRTVGPWELPDQ